MTDKILQLDEEMEEKLLKLRGLSVKEIKRIIFKIWQSN